MKNLPKNKGIVLFDGYCNLCSGSVQFIIKRDLKRFFF
ncbi:MAG: DCC1-like thiol-disulfide oxidoreductase family protein [Bacteroidales bacterium]